MKKDNWSKHLEDSSIPGGLKRCLKALAELWNTTEVAVFVREPGGTIFQYSVDEDEQLEKTEVTAPGDNVSRLLQLSVPAERYYDASRKLLYLRQRRADKPHAVLRISDVERDIGQNFEVAESTKAILMAAVAYVESYAYIQNLQEPLVAQRLKSDFRSFIVPICEQISKRSFLASIGILESQDSERAELLYGSHYLNGSVAERGYGGRAIAGISDIIESRPDNQSKIGQISSSNLGRLRAVDDGFLEGVEHILYYSLAQNRFRGAMFFGIPRDYEITESDLSIMGFIKDQFLNYTFIYTSYNEERYALYSQQQEFGLEYAQDFTQVARHAARQNIGDIVENADLLNVIAADGASDEENRQDAYQKISVAVEKIENVYNEVKSLTDASLPLDEIDVRELFDDVAAAFHVEFGQNSIKFENNLREGEIINAYAQQLKVALFNLFQNSCEAFERNSIKKKHRKIVVENSGRKTKPIAYQDTAGGIRGLKSPIGEEINDEQKAWVRGVSGSGGSGFGMHLIKRYLEANQCQVSLSTTKQGTRFLIEIENTRKRQ